MADHKLDNPIWFSLSETHSSYAINNDQVKFYQPQYCLFGGLLSAEYTGTAIAQYASLINNFYIVGNRPVLPPGLEIKKELVCLQMICSARINGISPGGIQKLTPPDHQSLYDLVNLVQPGYFRPKTGDLGDYFGIVKNGELIAAAGERMKMNEFTEISAVVTHPDHTGKGYASTLVAHTVNAIMDQHKLPVLHVAASNHNAIRLYQKLGFTVRRNISFWNVGNK